MKNAWGILRSAEGDDLIPKDPQQGHMLLGPRASQQGAHGRARELNCLLQQVIRVSSLPGGIFSSEEEEEETGNFLYQRFNRIRV